MKSLPSCVRRIFLILCATFVPFFLARLVMLVIVLPEADDMTLADMAKALYIGGKFDMRLAVFVSIPAAVTLGLPWTNTCLGRASSALKTCLVAVYAVTMLAVTVVYAFDFGFYFYLRQRIDTTLFDLIPDFALSASMVWQSYPVIRIALGLVAITLFFAWLMRRLLRGYTPSGSLGVKRRLGWTLFTVAALFLLAYGQISSNLFPLRWSNAYFSPNRFLVILALNPVQNLRDSYAALRATQPDVQAAREVYPRMAALLGVDKPDAERLNYWRTRAGHDALKPNIVIIIMESLGTPRTSLDSGLFAPGYVSTDPGASDPTPNLRKLSEESLYFPWFFAPTRTTARAVFTTISGVPDVNRSGGTSSRNPALVNQFSILNEFAGYDKSYMLGGSASWANIRGVLTYNIKDLRLLEEGHWKSPDTDVWGISDLALLRESIDYFDTCGKPFISVIQTAGFHRPWTIPEDNAGFVPLPATESTIRHYGFENADEYNSMRFSDHALGEFFRLAKNKPWFANTVFAVFGDHGLNERSENMPGGYLACRLQSNHVPLLLYAPGRPDLVQPGVLDIPSGQPDVLPTLAELAGVPYRNNGMGRNLLDPARGQKNREGQEYQFLGGDAESFVRVLQDGHCYFNEEHEALFLVNGTGENIIQQEPERAKRLRAHSFDSFHTSKYMLFNNRKEDAPPLP